MRKYLLISAAILAQLSCAKEKVAPEQRISGKFAEDGGSGLSNEYIKLEEAIYTSYLSIDNKPVTFAEGTFWNSTEKTFNKHIQAGYRISSENLFIDGKDYGKIRLEGDNLTIGDKHYTRIKSFETECYSSIVPEKTSVSVPYIQSTDTVACSISRPIPAGKASVYTRPDFVSSASFDGENLIFTVVECSAQSDRSGKIVLAYTNAADVEIEVKQEQQTFIILPSTSAEMSYQAGTGQFPFSIENPVEGDALSAQCESDWVHDLSVDGNNVSFSYDENNTSAARTAVITCSCSGAKAVSFALKQIYSAPAINTDPASTTTTYSGGSFSIDCTIDNPREDATITASTTSPWITGIKVEDGKMSFNVAENNSSAQRSGTIKLSYGVSGTTYATKDHIVAQNGAPVTSLTLNKTSLAMNAGGSETLIATVTPSDATLVWSSSNTSVATVDGNGKVTAKANGTTTITVKTADLSKTATCAVTVTTAVTGISLNKTTLSLNVGSSETLVATVAPSTASNKAVTWTSSSTSIATVDRNGKVTAKAEGSATITVKTMDGNKTAECSVNVVDNSIPVDLGLSVKWAQCNLGASTPEGYGDYYAWGATEPWYKDGYAQSSSPQWKSGKSGGYSWANCPFNGGYSSYNSSYWNAHKSECVGANNTLLPANDAAHVNLGGNWRMPTAEEFDELKNTSNCFWTWTTLNGIKGYKVQSKKTGYTENWIFLPAAGDRNGTVLSDTGSEGHYWSSFIGSSSSTYVWTMYFDSRYLRIANSDYRSSGSSIRPVTE